MTVHGALVCGDGCRCRHLWGSCDCPVCRSKREDAIERGDAMLKDRRLDALEAPDEPDQGTLDDYAGAES